MRSLYLAVDLDPASRRVIGWAMRPTLAESLFLDALHMAPVGRTKPCSGHRA